MTKRDTWIQDRHAIVTKIACAVLKPYCEWKYGISIETFTEQKAHPYLILMNHQTPFDQFFVGISFSGPVYYMATEDIFSIGWVSSLIRWLVAPIPIKKGNTDIQAVKSCIRIAKEGGTIAIAPEGNRTYSGKTEYMNPAIGALAKKLGLPIAIYKIEGGYGVQPRWSDVVRKGKMRAYVSRVIEPEEYKNLSKEELFSMIQEGLYVNEANADNVFHHKKRAEYLERVVYVCPFCGLAEFESRNEEIHCKTCGRRITYESTTALRGIGCEFPFRFVNDWYEYQKEYVKNLDLEAYADIPMFEDAVRLSEVILQKRKRLLRKRAKVLLFGNKIQIDDDLVLPFGEISVAAVLGKNKLNLYHKDMVYQLKGSKRFNALKYVNMIYHYKNKKKGDNNDEFLGL